MNGDGRDDIVTFTGGALADVFVALSTGTGFGGSAKWHDSFAMGLSQPRLGDFTDDGKADIASFAGDDTGDVYVAASTGSGFAPFTRWHDWFGLPGETTL